MKLSSSFTELYESPKMNMFWIFRIPFHFPPLKMARGALIAGQQQSRPRIDKGLLVEKVVEAWWASNE